MPKKAEKKTVEEPEQSSVEAQDLLAEAMTEMLDQTPDLRTMMLYGEVEEEKIQELIVGLLVLTEGAGPKSYDEEGKLNPLKFYISTYGGAVRLCLLVSCCWRQAQKVKDILVSIVGL